MITSPRAHAKRLDLDGLISRTREEARRRSGSEYPPLPHPVSFLSSFAQKDTYRLRDFLVISDADFLTCAYQAILKREPDGVGYRTYRAILNKGGSRAFVLADLLFSAEAKQYSVRVRGLRWIVLFKFLPAKRLLKPLLGALEMFSRATYPGFDSAVELNRLRHGLHESQQGMRQAVQERDSYILRLKGQVEQLQRDLDLSAQLNELTRTWLQVCAGKETESATAEEQGPLSVEKDPSRVLSVLRKRRQDCLGAYYAAFEDAFRGGEEAIKASLAHYLEDIERSQSVTDHTPLLDIGCGRGEWLLLLREHGIAAQGIDTNGFAVSRCRERGLDVQEIDAVSYLRMQGEGSAGAVSAFHLIEHLPFSELYDLLEQAYKVLCPGGLLILETPNPENLVVGSHTFYHDPTHRNPMTPAATAFLVRYFGFTEPEIRRLHPCPEAAKIPGDDPLTERVNGYLCGPQDFAVLARKPGPRA
jgi:SAM-dependent methyltransferase